LDASFSQILLVTLWSFIIGIDQFNGLFHIHRPLVTGLVIGLILGDLPTGLVTGATLELVAMGMVPLAGAQPPNMVIGGVIGVSFAIISKLQPEAAVAIAIPFAIAAQGCVTLIFTAFSPLMHKADSWCDEVNTRAINLLNYAGMFTHGAFFALVTFLPIYFGASSAQAIVEAVPAWILGGLGVAGGMMPAIGFAMLLKIMLKKEYVAFLLAGFILVTYFHISILGLAVLGACIALYDFYSHGGTDEKPRAMKREVHSDGI
jgi:PTS system N-acetylgalactosamine-specific IIC component